jgi:hypothetical protein
MAYGPDTACGACGAHLPVPAFLRLLFPEHRAAVEVAQGQLGMQLVLNVRPDDAWC